MCTVNYHLKKSMGEGEAKCKQISFTEHTNSVAYIHLPTENTSIGIKFAAIRLGVQFGNVNHERAIDIALKQALCQRSVKGASINTLNL